jgi:hypothetical protein
LPTRIAAAVDTLFFLIAMAYWLAERWWHCCCHRSFAPNGVSRIQIRRAQNGWEDSPLFELPNDPIAPY